ncbi:protein of unknown function [Taphrina deformans PYCC 5710]|uniref:Uncharacterized protein n=1 Tax=Taphrina deformans (strain PYCC 5710 / ATCC 11124 / CBS 356.35 / IMI 108563 / JCM 9778 / NBRC 8474) TaxID=1097556 RepID=R4XDD7_TAPDE|nr:protein of unknown function [Taphrina deformans PYCC 5710]|eukprot:CCG83621.1 protein of unknown function [Taphrina deformans PYCC 5710]
MSSSSASAPEASGKANAPVSPDTDLSMKSLAGQVVQIATLVKQNTKLLMQHGEDIMRIDAARMGISSTNGQALEQPTDQEGLIGELVQELQVKLDELEERSIRRTANTFARESTDVVEWMPSPDPDTPELPAMTLVEFEGISTERLLESMKFYGLAHYEEGMPLPNEAEFTALFNECARFLGVRSRKTA